MKLKILSLNSLDNRFANIETGMNNIKINRTFNRKYNLKNNKNIKKGKFSLKLFSNNTFQKNSSIDTNEDSKIPFNYKLSTKSKYSTLVPKNIFTPNKTLPVMKMLETNLSSVIRFNSFSNNKIKVKKSLELSDFNDERFFCTTKTQKRFIFPKQKSTFKKNRINHDINFFNARNAIIDHTGKYEKNSYKLKKMINNDIFINKIKRDLLKMKFSNRIKLFDKLY